MDRLKDCMLADNKKMELYETMGEHRATSHSVNFRGEVYRWPEEAVMILDSEEIINGKEKMEVD